MCKTKGECKITNRSELGGIVFEVLSNAKMEKRLIHDLLPTISYFDKNADDILICFISEISRKDPARHMQLVLLEAFCNENYIPVIQVDSSQKLGNYCGITNTKIDCPCAIVTRDENLPVTGEGIPMSPLEQYLTDFYECTLKEFSRPIIKLDK